MSNLRRKSADSCEALGLQKPLFHRPKIRAILKNVYETRVPRLVHAFHRHVDHFSYAGTCRHKNRLIEGTTLSLRSLPKVVIDVRSIAEFVNVATFQLERRDLENMFRRGTNLDDLAGGFSDHHSFMEAAHALLCIKNQLRL